jgi:hypothetical protein
MNTNILTGKMQEVFRDGAEGKGEMGDKNI